MADILGIVFTTIDTAIKAYTFVKDTHDIPKAFQEVKTRLPLVAQILNAARRHVQGLPEDSPQLSGVKDLAAACDEKATKLKDILEKTLPHEDDNKLQTNLRYLQAKASGRAGDVAKLMEGILRDVQILSMNHGMQITTAEERETLADGIETMSDPSMIDDPPAADRHVVLNDNAKLGSFIAGNAGSVYGDGHHMHGSGNTMNIAQNIVQNFNNDPSLSYRLAQCSKSLSAIRGRDVRAALQTTKGTRVPDTCEWINEHSDFQHWLFGDTNLLWIHGAPGKGKTMLSIYLTEVLEKRIQSTILYFFCSNQAEWRDSKTMILIGLLFQIVEHQPSTCTEEMLGLFETVVQHERDTESVNSFCTPARFEALWRIFVQIIQSPLLNPVFCVLDGLDECDHDSSRDIARRFCALLDSKNLDYKRFKLIVVSQPIRSISVALSKQRNISLDAKFDCENDSIQSLVTNDVKIFIKCQLNLLCEEVDGLETEPELFASIERKLEENANDTFLFVGLWVDDLRQRGPWDCVGLEEVLAEQMPTNLNGLFDRLLLRIDQKSKKNAATIFHWLLLAVRPLTLKELSVAIALDTKISLERAMLDILKACGTLLYIQRMEEYPYDPCKQLFFDMDTVHPDNGSWVTHKVTFVHSSVKEYLLYNKFELDSPLSGFRTDVEEIHWNLADRCLEYMQESGGLLKRAGILTQAPKDENFEDGLSGMISEMIRTSQSRMQDCHLVAAYPWHYWTKHAELCGPFIIRLLEMHASFFLGESLERGHWRNLYMRHPYCHRRKSYLEPAVWPTCLLHVACSLGFENWVAAYISQLRTLKATSVGLNMVDEQNRSALYWAVWGGYSSIVQMLLTTEEFDKYNHINRRSSAGLTPLSSAIIRDHHELAQLLLSIDNVDVNVVDHEGRTVLMLALEGCNEILPHLLEAPNINLHARDLCGRSSLHHAIMHGRLYGDSGPQEAALARLKQLLNVGGMDVNVKDQLGRSPLHLAVQSGNAAVISLLLNMEAIDVNARDAEEQPPVWYAIKQKDDACLAALLHHDGLDLNCKVSDDIDSRKLTAATPIMLALQLEYVEAVKLLLGHKAISQSVGCEHDFDRASPLALACKHGNVGMTQVLLDRQDFEHNFQGRIGLSLLNAVRAGNAFIVRLLLSTGKADLRYEDYKGVSLLEEAECKAVGILASWPIPLVYRQRAGQAPSDEHQSIVALLAAASQEHEKGKMLNTSNSKVQEKWMHMRNVVFDVATTGYREITTNDDNVRCDGQLCRLSQPQSYIQGDSFTCVCCDNFDLCAQCKAGGPGKEHDNSHYLVLRKRLSRRHRLTILRMSRFSDGPATRNRGAFDDGSERCKDRSQSCRGRVKAGWDGEGKTLESRLKDCIVRSQSCSAKPMDDAEQESHNDA